MDGGNLMFVWYGGNLIFMLNITLDGGIRDKLVVRKKGGQRNCDT
jgi:hypothetical protein